MVTTDVPGCRDAIRVGETGILVPARDAVALALALRELLGDRPRMEAMGRAGRALAERSFSVEGVIDATLGVYRQVAPTVLVDAIERGPAHRTAP